MKRRDYSSPFSLFSFQDIITGLCGIIILFVLIMIVDLILRRDAAPVPDVAVELEDSSGDVAAIVKEIADLEKRLEQLRADVSSRRVQTSEGVSAERLDEANRDLSEKEKAIAALLSQVDALRTRLEKAKDADAESKRVLHEMELARRKLETSLAALKKKDGITLIPERGNLKSPVYLVVGNGNVDIHRPLDRDAKSVRIPFRDLPQGVRNALSSIDPATHTVVLLVRASGSAQMMPLAGLVRDMGFACGRDPLEEDVEIAFGDEDGGAK